MSVIIQTPIETTRNCFALAVGYQKFVSLGRMTEFVEGRIIVIAVRPELLLRPSWTEQHVLSRRCMFGLQTP